MSEETEGQTEGEALTTAAATEAPKATKPRAPKVPMFDCIVLRDYWTKGDGSEDDRVRAGTVVSVTAEDALAGVEAGTLKRA